MSESANGEVIWAIIPAAGIGRRFGGGVAKQHRSFAGSSALQRSLEVLLAEPRVTGAAVALAADDGWQPFAPSMHGKPVYRCRGGKERSDSVLNAMETILQAGAGTDDWVLVHDAARPLLRPDDLAQLIQRVLENGSGGLLAIPVRDTIKQADAHGRVMRTLPRQDLWQAQTPQMFRLAPLQNAIQGASDAGLNVTDEASAMEWVGMRPLLIKGHADNLKLTHPEDLGLAERILRSRTERVP